jgi:hypothetical protein
MSLISKDPCRNHPWRIGPILAPAGEETIQIVVRLSDDLISHTRRTILAVLSTQLGKPGTDLHALSQHVVDRRPHCIAGSRIAVWPAAMA